MNKQNYIHKSLSYQSGGFFRSKCFIRGDYRYWNATTYFVRDYVLKFYINYLVCNLKGIMQLLNYFPRQKLSNYCEISKLKYIMLSLIMNNNLSKRFIEIRV